MTEFHTERALDEGQAPAFYLTEEHHPKGARCSASGSI